MCPTWNMQPAEQTECRQVPSKFLAVRAFSTLMSCTPPSFLMHTTIYFWHTHTHFLSNSFLYLPRIINMRDMINGLNKKKKRNNSEKLTLLSSYIYNWVLSSTRYNWFLMYIICMYVYVYYFYFVERNKGIINNNIQML